MEFIGSFGFYQKMFVDWKEGRKIMGDDRLIRNRKGHLSSDKDRMDTSGDGKFQDPEIKRSQNG